MTYATTVTQKGQVTIPLVIRRRLNILPRQRVIFEEQENNFVLKPYRDFLSLKGSLKTSRKYSDKKANQSIEKTFAQDYAKKISH
jgi:AbrB family looped-hinge helix DNA binding protein